MISARKITRLNSQITKITDFFKCDTFFFVKMFEI